MIEVTGWKDNEDGSAYVTIEMSNEEKDLFAGLGILYCIQEGIKKSGDKSDE